MEKDVLEAESTLEVSVSSLIQLLAAPKVDKSRAAALLSAALSQLRFYRFLLLVSGFFSVGLIMKCGSCPSYCILDARCANTAFAD